MLLPVSGARSRPLLANAETHPEAARGRHGHQAHVAEVESECPAQELRAARGSLGTRGTWVGVLAPLRQSRWPRVLVVWKEPALPALHVVVTVKGGITTGNVLNSAGVFYPLALSKAVFKVASVMLKPSCLGCKVRPHTASPGEGAQLFGARCPQLPLLR